MLGAQLSLRVRYISDLEKAFKVDRSVLGSAYDSWPLSLSVPPNIFFNLMKNDDIGCPTQASPLINEIF